MRCKVQLPQVLRYRKEQLVFHFVGRDKTGKSKAYGDVQDKQSGKRYYVNIDWVDNEGWKPVLVQTLN